MSCWKIGNWNIKQLKCQAKFTNDETFLFKLVFIENSQRSTFYCLFESLFNQVIPIEIKGLFYKGDLALNVTQTSLYYTNILYIKITSSVLVGLKRHNHNCLEDLKRNYSLQHNSLLSNIHPPETFRYTLIPLGRTTFSRWIADVVTKGRKWSATAVR